MNRIKCLVSYDGTHFHGFQVQDQHRTVQGELQKAIRAICREDIIIHGSGRTDRKVHAKGQVFHFDTTRQMPEWQWQRAINHFLPEDIYVYSCQVVSEDFHARYSAIKKEYHYIMNTGIYDPLQTNYIYQYGKSVDLDAMIEASKLFIGTHNFASFCANDPYGNTTRTMYTFTIERKNTNIHFKLIGNGFRRYMVRHIVGGIIQVGAHRIDTKRLAHLLESEGKEKCLYKAKPQGLYLYKVYYGEEEED